jgi:hypothetical protein
MTQDMPPFVRSWLDQVFDEAPDPGRMNEAVAAAVHQTSQQRGWLPRLDVGRSQTMFAAIKLAAATASLALSGLLVMSLLSAQEPGEGPSVGAPASSSLEPTSTPDPMRAAWVTGTCPYSGTQAGSPTVSVEDGVTMSYGEAWKDFRPCDMSDPRLIGTGRSIYNTHMYAVEGDDPIVVMSTSYRIENDAGSWEYTGAPGLARGPGTLQTVTDTGVFVGDGAYEGLTAYLVFDFSRNPVRVTGAIFPGELPPIATLE